MTALVIATDIPTNINTLERLTTWGILALATINPTTAVLESPNRAEYATQYSVIKAADGTVRLIGRVSLELDGLYASDTSKKLWMFTKEVGGVLIPAGFKAN